MRGTDSCGACHCSIALPLRLKRPRRAPRTAFQDDVHASGAASRAVRVMAGGPRPPVRPLGRDARQIAPLCAKCHSDAAYMRQFDPQVRMDQFAQYVTSVQGSRWPRARTASRRAATATAPTASSGHETRVPRSRHTTLPDTCARCHADAVRMQAFNREPTPNADWSASVHAAALLKRGDTSAPTCSTCHGSHGAAPPGVTQVANVCAQCHVREAELFRASPKKAIFDAIGQAECLVCHSNHRIESPEDAWIGLTEGAVCATCHDESVAGGATIKEIRQQLDRCSTPRWLRPTPF